MKAAKFKILKDIEMDFKMHKLREGGQITPPQLSEMRAIEISKISDGLMVEFGFDLGHLGDAVRHYSLENSNELKAFRQAAMAKSSQNLMQAQAEQNMRPPPS